MKPRHGVYFPRLWMAMIEAQSFTVPEMLRAIGAGSEDNVKATLYRYFNELVEGGVLRRIDSSNAPNVYQIIAEADLVKLPASHRIWHYIWNRKSFQITDLVSFALVSRASARRYTYILHSIGYLAITDRPAKRSQPWTFKLIAQTGPEPLQIKRTSLYDPNTKQTYQLKDEDPTHATDDDSDRKPSS